MRAVSISAFKLNIGILMHYFKSISLKQVLPQNKFISVVLIIKAVHYFQLVVAERIRSWFLAPNLSTIS